MTVIASVRALLEHAVDYAGTFPPAALPLHEAVANFVRERHGGDAWLLGRLVVLAGSLDDVEKALPAEAVNGIYQLSVIVSSNHADTTVQLERVSRFNERVHQRAHISSIEFSPAAAADIPVLASRAGGSLEVFFESPLDAGLDERLDAISNCGAAAKVRTGGTVPSAIPPASSLADFLQGCARRRLPFKATAGLHHAIRSCYPLTYERNSETAVMHGFVNVGVAATIAHRGGSATDIAEALTASPASAFEFSPEGLVYRGSRIDLPDLARMRHDFFRSFGSCAFREPVEELARLQLV